MKLSFFKHFTLNKCCSGRVLHRNYIERQLACASEHRGERARSQSSCTSLLCVWLLLFIAWQLKSASVTRNSLREREICACADVFSFVRHLTQILRHTLSLVNTLSALTNWVSPTMIGFLRWMTNSPQERAPLCI